MSVDSVTQLSLASLTGLENIPSEASKELWWEEACSLAAYLKKLLALKINVDSKTWYRPKLYLKNISFIFEYPSSVGAQIYKMISCEATF